MRRPAAIPVEAPRAARRPASGRGGRLARPFAAAVALAAGCVTQEPFEPANASSLPATSSAYLVEVFLDECVDRYAREGRVGRAFSGSDFVRAATPLAGPEPLRVLNHRTVRAQAYANDLPARGYSVCSIRGVLADRADLEATLAAAAARRYAGRVVAANVRPFGPSLVYVAPSGRRIVFGAGGSDGRGALQMNATPTR